MIRTLVVRILSHVFESTTLRKKLRSREILIQKAPLPLVRSHSVSKSRFKRRLVDFLSSSTEHYKRREGWRQIIHPTLSARRPINSKRIWHHLKSHKSA